MTNPYDPNNPNPQNPTEQSPQQPGYVPGQQNAGNEYQTPGYTQYPYPTQENNKKSKTFIAIGSSVAVIGILGIFAVAAFAYKAFTGETSGASKPEGVITNTFAALEKQDLLGAAKNMDPSEMGPFIENYSIFTEALEKNEDILDKDKPLESYIFESKDIETKTVEYSDDVARVELLNGVVSAKTDKTKLPDKEDNDDTLEIEDEEFDIKDANEQWRNGFASDITESYAQEFGVDSQDTEFDKDKLESENIFYIAVKRDGRWYFSSLYTTVEYGRILANASGANIPRPNFDASLRKGDGADSPEEAVESMIENLFSKDAVSKIFPPERLSVVYDYQGAKDKSNNETLDVDFLTKALENSLTVKNIDTSSTADGKNRQFVTIESLKFNFSFEPDLENTDSPIATFIPEMVDVDVDFDGKCVAYDGLYRYNFTAFSTPDPDVISNFEDSLDDYEYDFETEFDYDTDPQVSYSDVNYTGNAKPSSVKASNRRNTNETFSGKECLSDTDINEIGVTTIKEDGKYYFSPIDTLWHYAIKAVQSD